MTDPNVSERRINLLSIELRRTSGLNNLESHDLDPVVWVIFDKDDRPFQTSQVKVSISCPDKTWALMLADELEPQITRLFKVKKFPVWVISLLPLILTLIVYRTSSWLGFQHEEVKEHTKIAALTCVTIFMMFYGYNTSSQPKSRVFNILSSEPVFLWGEEVSAFTERESLKNKIFWIVIVGFIVSFAAGAFSLLI